MTGSLPHPGAEQIAATRITAGHDEDQGARTLRTHDEERAAHSIYPRQAAGRRIHAPRPESATDRDFECKIRGP
jgi:hypothetical protein